jgi:hypothetical protein
MNWAVSMLMHVGPLFFATFRALRRTPPKGTAGAPSTMPRAWSPDWIKMKNLACEAVRREDEEDWSKNK